MYIRRVTSPIKRLLDTSLCKSVTSPMRHLATRTISFQPPKMRHLAETSLRQKSGTWYHWTLFFSRNQTFFGEVRFLGGNNAFLGYKTEAYVTKWEFDEVTLWRSGMSKCRVRRMTMIIWFDSRTWISWIIKIH